MINSEIELILKWSEDCVLTEKPEREEKPLIPAQGGNAEILHFLQSMYRLI